VLRCIHIAALAAHTACDCIKNLEKGEEGGRRGAATAAGRGGGNLQGLLRRVSLTAAVAGAGRTLQPLVQWGSPQGRGRRHTSIQGRQRGGRWLLPPALLFPGPAGWQNKQGRLGKSVWGLCAKQSKAPLSLPLSLSPPLSANERKLPAGALLQKKSPNHTAAAPLRVEPKVRVVGLHKLVLCQDLVALVVAAVEQLVGDLRALRGRVLDVDKALGGRW
jgi:hypothetical protein